MVLKGAGAQDSFPVTTPARFTPVRRSSPEEAAPASSLPAAELVVRALVEQALAWLGTPGGSSAVRARETIERAAGIAAAGDGLEGLVLHARGKLHWQEGQVLQAGECFEEARLLLEKRGRDDDLARVLDSLAMFHEHCGDREQSLSYYALSLVKKNVAGDVQGLAITLGNLGRLQLRRQQPGIALAFLQEDLRLAERLRDPRGMLVVKINIGQALTELGRLVEAAQVLEGALATAAREGFKEQEAYALKDLARVRARSGDGPAALELVARALDVLAAEPASYARGQILLTQGDLLFAGDDLEGARSAYAAAREAFAALHCHDDEGLAVHGLARVADRLGERNSCLCLVEEAMDLLPAADTQVLSSLESLLSGLTPCQPLCPRSVGPYRILEQIGGGTFADVYRAFDQRDGGSRADVAVKLLRLDGARSEEERGDRVARFLREHEIQRHVSHPNIVRVLDLGTDPSPYIVEEFVPGGDLKSLLEDGVGVPWPRAIHLLRGILHGLAALHRLGIVHRDLKPGNVLLRADGEPVIADFGLATMVDLAALTLRPTILGTLQYMAPEQLRGAPTGPRSDVFSFGVLAFQLLSGSLPFAGDGPRALLRAIERRNPRRLDYLRPEVPRGVADLIHQAMAPEAAQRPASAVSALAALEAVETP